MRSKKLKISHFSTVRGTFPLVLSVKFCTMNNFVELQLLPMMEFSFNTFTTLIFDSFPTKVCLRFHRWCFFSSEKVLFRWTNLLKKIPRRTKILISPIWYKILKDWDTFWAHKYRSAMQQKVCSNVFTTRSWSFWK